MKAISIFNGEGLFSIESLINLSKFDIEEAKKDRTYLFRNDSRKWNLSEIYGHLKKAGELPELPLERKKEIWKEAKKDKLLYLSLYVIEII